MSHSFTITSPHRRDLIRRVWQVLDSDNSGAFDIADLVQLFNAEAHAAEHHPGKSASEIVSELQAEFGRILSHKGKLTLDDFEHYYAGVDKKFHKDADFAKFIHSHWGISETDTAATVPPPPTSETRSGKKRALLIGINYHGMDCQLEGCVNDTQTTKHIVTSRFGYPDAEIRVLVDDGHGADHSPTKHNIIEGIRWLVGGTQAGDSLFFHYSGHGSQVHSRTSLSVDNDIDDTLVPLDFRSAGMILDEELHKMLVDVLPAGVHLFALLDCCHSGTALDLPWTYVPGVGVQKAEREPKEDPASVLMLSGCRDDQTSADARPTNHPAGGALTLSFEKAIQSKPGASYHEMILETRRVLVAGHYEQVPQLSTEHKDYDFMQQIII